MVFVPLPADLSSKISDRAAQYAREELTKRQWKSATAINSKPGIGQVGLQTTVKYLMYQERGTKPHVQHELAGKFIPMKLGGRYANPSHIGTPGWVSIPQATGGEKRVWRDQRWRHPGVKAQNFMSDALLRAIKEAGPDIRSLLKNVTEGKAP